MQSLLVILPFRLSAVIKKGELIDRYFNPGDLFDEVHILLTNDDQPDHEALKMMVGSAHVTLHNYPFKRFDFLRTAALRATGLKRWAAGTLPMIEAIGPDLIRCHDSGINAYLACTAKQALNIPYIVSIHSNPDEKMFGVPTDYWGRFIRWLLEPAAREALIAADRVIAVYKSQFAYLERIGVRSIELCYNVINPQFIQRKQDYSLHQPVRIVSVGRHFAAKNPQELIRALASLPNVKLTLIGDGPLQPRLEQLAVDLGLAGRVHFIHAMPNDEVCKFLVSQDVFAIHVENEGISKTAMEAMLSGMPTVINRRVGTPVPELQGEHVRLVDNNAEGYAEAIRELIEDDDQRAALGQRAYDYAQAHWAPETTEARYVEIYQQVLAEAGHG